MKLKSKIMCLVLSAFLTFPLFTACTPESNDNDNKPVNYLKGTEAAKLMLANERINEHFADDDIISFDVGGVQLSSNEQVFLADDRVGIDYSTKGFSLTDTHAKWGNIPSSSNELQATYATIINMSGSARNTAQLFAEIKKDANITDTWLPISGKSMLKVGEADETVLRQGGEDYKEIYRRFINNQGKNEYEWVLKSDESVKHERYVGGSYYESMYRNKDGFMDWFVIDNSRGYWNCMRLSEFDYEGDINDCYQITNAIISDEICIEFTIRFYKNGKYEKNTLTFIEPDLSNDIVSFSFDRDDNTLTGMNIYVGAVDGVNGLVTPVDNLTYFDYATAMQTPKPSNVHKVQIELNDGRVINNNEVIIQDKAKYGYTDIDFTTHATYGNLDYKYAAKSQFYLTDVANVVEGVEVYNDILTALNLTPKFNMQKLINNSTIADGFIDNFNEYYEWNGYNLNSYDIIRMAIEGELASKTNEYVKYYDDSLNAPSLTIEELNALLKLNPNAKFGKVASYYDGNVELKDGVISVTGATATVNDFTYFDLDSEYKLHYGIAKLKDQNVSNTSLVGSHGRIQLVSSTNKLEFDEVWLLPLSNEEEQKTTCASANFVDGEVMSFTQSGNYALPEYLSEGKYVLVSYIAEASEGIRVTDYTPVTFGLSETCVVEHELGKYTAQKDDSNNLKFTAVTFLDKDFEISELKTQYTYNEVSELLYLGALSYGLPHENNVVEVYNEDLNEYTAVNDDTMVFTTQKVRMKYYRITPLGKEEAYILCQLKVSE